MFSPENKDKLFETFWLFWAYLLVGFNNGLLGSCLPDLRQATGVSLQMMSYVFLVQGIGALCGGLVALYPERYWDRRLLTAVYVLLGSVVNALIPLKADYCYMMVGFLLQGNFMGMTDFAAMSLCNALWEKHKALTFQFIIVGVGVAAFISPLIAQPFIKAKATQSVSLLQDDCPQEVTINHTLPLLTSQHVDTQSGNFSYHYNGTDVMSWQMSNSSSGADDSLKDIKWPFIIAGIMTLPAALVFFYIYFTKPKLAEQTLSHTEKQNEAEDSSSVTCCLLQSDKGKPPSWAVRLFRGTLIFLHIPVFGLQMALADLLTSIGMMSPFCLTAPEANYFTTVLWATSLSARALGVIFLCCFSVYVHLIFNSVALVISGAVLVAGVGGNVVALWVGTAGVGLFGTSFMPGYITWSSQYLPITPLFMNLSLVMASFGDLLLPFMSGQLLAVFGSWVMAWAMLLVTVLMLGLFFGLDCLARRFLIKERL
ncbi:hypothetical protein ACOMHN_066000 [Nucella lapillus]